MTDETRCPKCGMDDWHCDSEMDYDFFRQGPKCRAEQLENVLAIARLALENIRQRPSKIEFLEVDVALAAINAAIPPTQDTKETTKCQVQ